MLLAAGEGRRLRPLTNDVPKPMVSVGGKPVLEHNVRLLAAHGVKDIVINLHHCPDAVTRHFGDGAAWGVRIVYSHEPELLGTAGAVKRAEAHFQGGSFLVLYGDNLTTCDLGRMIARHRERRAVATLAVWRREHAAASGVVAFDNRHRITRFVEKPGPDGVFSDWVNAGAYVLEPSVLDAIPGGRAVDFGRDVFPRLLADGALLGAYTFGAGEQLWWIDTPADLARVQAEWEGRQP